MEFVLQHHFDPQAKRHYLNSMLSVVHCHHYTSLMVQLADDAKEWHAHDLMRESFAECTYEMLSNYYKNSNIQAIADKVKIAIEYFRYLGMGKLNLDYAAQTANMPVSHVDEGWLSKWGQTESAINSPGQGFIIGAFAAMSGTPIQSWAVTETQSIVKGDQESKFVITKR